MQRPNRPAWSQCVANSMPQCSCDHGANIGATKIPRNNYLFETMTMQHTPRMRRSHFFSSICALATKTQKHKGNGTLRPTSSDILFFCFCLTHLPDKSPSGTSCSQFSLLCFCASVARAQIHWPSKSGLTRKRTRRGTLPHEAHGLHLTCRQ